MLSQDALQKILGIEEKVHVSALEMADNLNITFFPDCSQDISQTTIDFSRELRRTLEELKVNIVPYEDAIEYLSILKVAQRFFKLSINNIIYTVRAALGLPQKSIFIKWSSIVSSLKRKRIKKGISVIVLGEQKMSNLPMEFIYSFKASSIITIVDFPLHIKEESTFYEHFDTAMSLFAYHMTNIVIAVDNKRWMLYNFNASHPIYPRNEHFKERVLHALIPKISAPISPHKFSEFKVLEKQFDPRDDEHRDVINTLVEGAKLFEKTNLYPAGKQIDSLPFRNDFHRWIGKLHLDNRNGMSFGFLAHQMPVELSKVQPLEDVLREESSNLKDDFFYKDKNLYIVITISEKTMCLKVPAVWVMSQRSGSDKTNINIDKDLIKLGIDNGKMLIQTPQNLVLHHDYKTSFDTKVILAHAVGNAIIASILEYTNPGNIFSKELREKGRGIAHWHGYFNPSRVPEGWIVHGVNNPHVACSSPQSALYALGGKLQAFKDLKPENEYKGDIHIEPHHGTNICFPTITELATMFINDPEMTVLGNKYLHLYENAISL